MVYHDRVFIFIQLMYNKLQPLSLPRPKRPFAYVVYVYSDMSLSKGHLGSGGGGGGGGGGGSI